MPDGSATLTLTLHQQIADVPAAEWDACAGDGNPFVSHAFLSALEDSGSANARTGWLPQHAVLRGEAGQVVAVAPMYAKSHSYGEYVFDHGWAHALERAGGDYYPKLQVAAPFSPAPGPAAAAPSGRRRAGGRAGIGAGTGVPSLDLSSVHVRSARKTNGSSLARPAGCSVSACSSIGRTPATRASTTSWARCRHASARCCGASGATPMPPA